MPSASSGAVAGGGEEAADAGAGGADALGQVALRDQLQLDFPGAVGRIEVPGVGLAREGADDLLDAAFLDQQREAGVGLAGVVVHDREVGGAVGQQCVDEFHRLAGVAEPADQDGCAVVDVGHCLCGRGGDAWCHGGSLLGS